MTHMSASTDAKLKTENTAWVTSACSKQRKCDNYHTHDAGDGRDTRKKSSGPLRFTPRQKDIRQYLAVNIISQKSKLFN